MILLAINLGWTIYRSTKPAQVRADSLHAHTDARTEVGYDKAGVVKFTNQHVEALRTDGSWMWELSMLIELWRDIYLFGQRRRDSDKRTDWEEEHVA